MEESAILTDYNTVIPNVPNLQKFLTSPFHGRDAPPQPLHDFQIGLLFILPKPILKELSDLPAGSKRISYINKKEFQESIVEYYYILYNKTRNICILPNTCYKHINSVLNAVFLEQDTKTTIWVNIPLEEDEFMEKIEAFVHSGFDSPYIAITSPMYVDIKPSVALMRETVVKDMREEMTLNKIYHVLSQYKKNKGSCYMNAKLTRNAVEFLKNSVHMGIMISGNKNKKQKELTGTLDVVDVVKKDEEIVYIIDIDEKTVHSGQEEEIIVKPTRYNFHSHPHEAYIRHSVKKAWPSAQDYVSYKKLGKDTIFHCVAGNEGLYIISFTHHWGGRLEKVENKFIEKNFDIDYRKKISPEEYVRMVNKIEYNGKPIFKVFYFPWEKAETVFTVFFPEINSSCLVTEETKQRHLKIISRTR